MSQGTGVGVSPMPFERRVTAVLEFRSKFPCVKVKIVPLSLFVNAYA